MSLGPAPTPPLPSPTNRSDPDSGAANSSVPVPEIWCAETADASGHPSQPAVLTSPPPCSATLIRLIQLTDPPVIGAGDGAGTGAGAGAGAGPGAGAGAGAG